MLNEKKKPVNTALSDKELEAVQDILIKALGVARGQLAAEARLEEDLGADSLALVEIGLALEERFGVSFPDDQLDQMKTVGDACEMLAKTLSSTDKPSAILPPDRGQTIHNKRPTQEGHGRTPAAAKVGSGNK